ncbi:MBL fold metallo-hydrolase [Virgibacillus sp. NKC19-3]|uniref:MBL fold metallo-hydrolase n=1 Tax=Virgibacillus saliphilus TaxID=2831674 RepID=UPI001C9AB9BC|nr:MBL fold metallo-hydrolase [Virgibacillus sp. NKC19-3]MBY7143060.1 MBL fold metallo-hydrolase [Virgibacillus sp. NKC19-3]
MKLTVIGCWGGYPAPNGATSAYLIEKDNFALLVDAGSAALSKLQTYKQVSDIDAVLLSHYHHDHVADIGVLQYAKRVQSYTLGNKEILPIYGHTDDKQGFAKLTDDYTKGMVYDPNTSLELGPFSITFLHTDHPVACYGMRITDGKSTLVYTADTSFKEEWIDFAKGADLLITDCNFYAEQDGSQAGHMTSREGGMIAERASAGELMLSHLPQYGERSQLVGEAKQNFKGVVHLAEEGFRWG